MRYINPRLTLTLIDIDIQMSHQCILFRLLTSELNES